MTTRPCPECGKTTKPYGAPTTAPSGFVDLIIVCSCGWSGVMTKWPGEKEAEKMLAHSTPKGSE